MSRSAFDNIGTSRSSIRLQGHNPTSFVIMVSDHFYLFTALASFNRSLQERLQSVQSPDDIVAIAAEKGYQISIEQLSVFSRRLRASYWIWRNQGDQWREQFFAQGARGGANALRDSQAVA
jgi:hypothetical protein